MAICEKESTPSYKVVESEARFYLVAIALEESDIENARKNLQVLKDLSDTVTVKPLINRRFQVAQALLMKSGTRLKEKLKAQDILVKILNEESIDHDLVVMSTIILCELLIDELRLSGDQEVLDEIKKLIYQLLEVAKNQSSFWLLAEVYVFQSRLNLLDLDLKKAENLLDQALILAEEKGLKKLAVKIYNEKINFESQVSQWDNLIERDAPLNDRLDLIQLESLLERMAYKKLESSEEETLNYAQRARQIAQTWDGY